MKSAYEDLRFEEKAMPIIFHTVTNNYTYFDFIHWHESLEILFFEKESGEILIDDTVVCARPGDIVVVNSEQLHSVRARGDVVFYSCLIIDKALCEQFGFSIDEQHIVQQINDKALLSLLSELKEEINNKGEYYMGAISAIVISILTVLYRKYPSGKKQYNKKRNMEMIKTAIKYIKQNFGEQISIDDIASYTGYSKYHFCRCFKEITGCTANAYLTNVRLDYAFKLLTAGNTTVTETAEKSGFSDISYFTKVFKKRFSKTPSMVKMASP